MRRCPGSSSDRRYALELGWQFGVGQLLVATLITAINASRLSRPLRQLTAAALRMRERDTTARVRVGRRRDEVSQLAGGFNDMSRSREEAEQVRRTMVADLCVRIAPDLTIAGGDPVRLNQALGNVVANAIRYTPPAGTVTITARPDVRTSPSTSPTRESESPRPTCPTSSTASGAPTQRRPDQPFELISDGWLQLNFATTPVT